MAMNDAPLSALRRRSRVSLWRAAGGKAEEKKKKNNKRKKVKEVIKATKG